MRVTQTFDAGAAGNVRRLVCSSSRCGAVAVTETRIVAVDPEWGDGAKARYKRMLANKKPASTAG